MSAIVMDEEVKTQMEAVKKYALEHRISLDQIQATIAGKIPPAGDDENRVIQFKGTGLRLVLSLEEQPAGWCWHISASVPKKGYLPSQPMLYVIMREMGFNTERVLSSWREPTNIPHHHALNILIGADNLGVNRN